MNNTNNNNTYRPIKHLICRQHLADTHTHFARKISLLSSKIKIRWWIVWWFIYSAHCKVRYTCMLAYDVVYEFEAQILTCFSDGFRSFVDNLAAVLEFMWKLCVRLDCISWIVSVVEFHNLNECVWLNLVA